MYSYLYIYYYYNPYLLVYYYIIPYPYLYSGPHLDHSFIPTLTFTFAPLLS